MTTPSQHPGSDTGADYETIRRSFRWEDVLEMLGWSADGPINVAATIADRHASSGRVAIDWHGREGERRTLSFADLATDSSRFAEVLAGLGVAKGDRVAMVMPRVPETIIAMLGIWKAGAVYVPIFSAFGADAIRMRLMDSKAKVLVTHAEYRASLAAVSDAAISVVVVGEPDVAAGEVGFDAAMASADGRFESVPVARRDPAVLLYTSGSTGPPKGVVVSANFVAAIAPGVRFCADLRADDIFWPTGDPAWGYGLVCYAVALAMGTPVVMWQAQPSGESALEFMAEVGVTNLATVPTLLRAMMALGEDEVRSHGLAVRRVWSCGEPLNAEVVRFFREVWGATPLDTYGSSEMGLPVGNLAATGAEVRPGSMGRPLPGHTVTIVDESGRELDDGEVGLIGLAPDPQGFYAVSYWNNPELTAQVFGGRWIVTNDLGRRDGDGYLWFEGRSDDVIKSAGYRIGPFEVESALIEHPAVAEAGVVGKPDPLRGHLVKAYVVLKPGEAPHEDLERELVDTVRAHLGAHATPREFSFVAELPKTESGKIQRFKLREQAAGE